MSIESQPDRREKILSAGFDVAVRYGYRRSSMDDIAQAAGISRTALYQFFKNKADIYRAVVQQFCEQSIAQVETELAKDHPFPDRLKAAIDVGVLAPHRMIQNMPHGEEIMDIKTEFATEVLAAWRDNLQSCFQKALTKEPAIDRKLALALSTTLMNTIDGTKSRRLSADEMAAEITQMLDVLAFAIKGHDAS